MKSHLLPLCALIPLGLLTSCQQNPLNPAPGAPPLASPDAQANPYGVPGASPVYTPEQSTPYQPINPPATAAPYSPPAPYTPPPSTYNPSTGSSGGSSHTIVKGESLWGISRKYGVSVDALRQANNLQGDTIIEGRSLNIPAR